VICNPLGKSGGALIQQFMIIGFGSLAASTPYLGLILLAIVGMWIFAAKDLDWRFAAAQEDMAKAAESADGDDSTAAPAAETKPASA
jgi:AAA family ATP:ADP antiporter